MLKKSAIALMTMALLSPVTFAYGGKKHAKADSNESQTASAESGKKHKKGKKTETPKTEPAK